MPSIRKRVYGIIKQWSSGIEAEELNEEEGANANILSATRPGCSTANQITHGHDAEASFIHMYLKGRLKGRPQPHIYHGKSGADLPLLQIEALSIPILAAFTGPDEGINHVPGLRKATRPTKNIANIEDELNISLVEEDFFNECTVAPVGGEHAEGDATTPTAATPSTPQGFLAASTFQECYKSKENGLTRGSGSGKRKRPTSPDGLLDSTLSTSTSLSVPASLADSELELSHPPVGTTWDRPHDRAYGCSTSLYESNPLTNVKAGNPVADVFAVCARENNCILLVADGVNWGEKARLAAQCAVRGAMDCLCDCLFDEKNPVTTTHELFRALFQSFNAGHQLIMQESGLLTTLCAVLVCKLAHSDNYVACACNVGDSLAFVYNEKSGVREITMGSHDIGQMRDMRDALGALGPVDGLNPELQNLTFSMTILEEGEIVFLTSDGISDNFDPVVGKFCITADEIAHMKSIEVGLLPIVEAHQRHELMLLRMEDLLTFGITEGDTGASTRNARDLIQNLIAFATQLTMAKRHVLEDPELYACPVSTSAAEHNPLPDSSALQKSQIEQRNRRRLVREKVAEMPGKLDHATVAAYVVGSFELSEREDLRLQPNSPILTNGSLHVNVSMTSSQSARFKEDDQDPLFVLQCTPKHERREAQQEPSDHRNGESVPTCADNHVTSSSIHSSRKDSIISCELLTMTSGTVDSPKTENAPDSSSYHDPLFPPTTSQVSCDSGRQSGKQPLSAVASVGSSHGHSSAMLMTAFDSLSVRMIDDSSKSSSVASSLHESLKGQVANCGWDSESEEPDTGQDYDEQFTPAERGYESNPEESLGDPYFAALLSQHTTNPALSPVPERSPSPIAMPVDHGRELSTTAAAAHSPAPSVGSNKSGGGLKMVSVGGKGSKVAPSERASTESLTLAPADLVTTCTPSDGKPPLPQTPSTPKETGRKSFGFKSPLLSRKEVSAAPLQIAPPCSGRKKHRRSSPTRHTLAVDVSLLRRLRGQGPKSCPTPSELSGVPTNSPRRLIGAALKSPAKSLRKLKALAGSNKDLRESHGIKVDDEGGFLGPKKILAVANKPKYVEPSGDRGAEPSCEQSSSSKSKISSSTEYYDGANGCVVSHSVSDTELGKPTLAPDNFESSTLRLARFVTPLESKV